MRTTKKPAGEVGLAAGKEQHSRPEITTPYATWTRAEPLAVKGGR